MNNTALLIVDMQNEVTYDLYQINTVMHNINRVKEYCQKQNIEVIYIQHDDGPGNSLTKGNPGWEINSAVAPNNNEKVFVKNYNSSFLHTGLKEYLNSKNISNLIITGAQTEYCMDATIKAAFEHGYRVIIPEGTNSTSSNEYLSGEKLVEYYTYKIWNHRFAKVIKLKTLLGGCL